MLSLNDCCSISSKPGRDLTIAELHRIAARENNDPPQENPNGYVVGGYIPMTIGSTFNDVYEIIRKLGYGQYSTVWLAHDTKNNRYVALKFCKGSRLMNLNAEKEIALLQICKYKDVSHIGYDNIVQMCDSFVCRSVHGTHTIIAFEIMQMSLFDLINLTQRRGVDLKGVHYILKKILRGLSYLHDSCNIIHSDLKPDNIMVKINDATILNMVETAYRFRELGVPMPKTYVGSNEWTRRPRHIRIVRDNELPSNSSNNPTVDENNDIHPQMAANVTPVQIDMTMQVKISDVGNALLDGKKGRSNLIQARVYRAVEVIQGSRWDFTVDIWSTACIAFELATGNILFDPSRNSEPIIMDLEHLKLIWEVLGGIPQNIAIKGANSNVFFTKSGHFKCISPDSIHLTSIRDLLINKYGLNHPDTDEFAAFIQWILNPCRFHRPSAKDILKAKWMTKN